MGAEGPGVAGAVGLGEDHRVVVGVVVRREGRFGGAGVGGLGNRDALPARRVVQRDRLRTPVEPDEPVAEVTGGGVGGSGERGGEGEGTADGGEGVPETNEGSRFG